MKRVFISAIQRQNTLYLAVQSFVRTVRTAELGKD